MCTYGMFGMGIYDGFRFGIRGRFDIDNGREFAPSCEFPSLPTSEFTMSVTELPRTTCSGGGGLMATAAVGGVLCAV